MSNQRVEGQRSVFGSRERRLLSRLASYLKVTAAIVALLSNNVAWAQQLPTGGSVAAGTATIAQPNSSTLNINQSTNQAVINWNTFSVGRGGTVNFNQPNSSSATLNRVTGSMPSWIGGTINAPGTVLLVNPNGIAITKSGVINTGSFAASTLDISNADFMAGKYKFTGNGGSAAVRNSGRINVSDGGFAALLGGQVANDGVISARLGKVGLGAGELITLDLAGDGFLSVAVPSSQMGKLVDSSGALVSNRGKIRADGGSVFLTAATASTILRDAVNVPGSIRANTVGTRDGKIVIGGGQGGRVSVTGKLAANGNSKRNGGKIEVTGANVALNGKVLANGKNGGNITVASSGDLAVAGGVEAKGSDGQGGRIDLTGANIKVIGALIDASGGTGGGLVRIGGTFQGGHGDPNDPLYQSSIGRFGALPDIATAQTVTIDAGSKIDVSAKTLGDGGTAVVWSEQFTSFTGAIIGTGGLIAGNGGFAEVSSHGVLDYQGATNLVASLGATGTLLLDPNDLVISATATSNAGSSPDYVAGATMSFLKNTDLQTALAGANITVTASGKITVSSSVSWSAATTLTMTSGDELAINASITNTNTGSALVLKSTGADVYFQSGTTNVYSITATGSNPGFGSIVTAGSNVISNGAGNVTLNAGADGINFNSGITTGTLTINSAGWVSQGTVAFTAANLLLTGAGDVELTKTTNKFGTLAANTTGVVNIYNNQALAIGTVGGVNGVTAGTLSLQMGTGFAVTQSQAIKVGNLTLRNSLSNNAVTYTLTNAANQVGSFAATLGTAGVAKIYGVNGLSIAEVIYDHSGNSLFGVASAGTLTISNTGSVTQSNRISASNLELLGTGGNYVLTSTSNVIGTLAANTGSINVSRSAAAALATGTVGSTVGITTTGNVTLTSAGAVTVGALGAINAGGAVVLTTTGAATAITLNNSITGVGVTLNSVAALAINNAINVGTGNVSLNVTGVFNGITQNASGVISGNTLLLSTNNGSVTLNTATNAITNLGTVTLGSGSLNLVDTGGLTVTGAVGATGGLTINTSGALAINAALSSGNGSMSLTTTGAGNAITQSASGIITANTLTLATNNADATLNTATNAINNLGTATLGSGALNLLNSGLSVGTVVATGGITINASGALTGGSLNAGTSNVSLTATGGYINFGGTITANTLTLSTSNGGGATVNASTNAITNLGTVTVGTGQLILVNAGGLTVTGAVGATGGINISAGGALVINAALNAGAHSMTLTTTGAGNTITQSASGIITTSTLSLTTSGGNVTLDTATNAVASLFEVYLGAGALALKTASAVGLTVYGGSSVVANGGIAIVNTTGSISTINILSVSNGAVALTATAAGAGITLGGTVTGVGVTLNSDAALTINTAINGGTGTVSLNVTGAGNAINQTGGGITAGTLTLATNNGTATLISATNAITNLGTTTLGTGALNLRDGGALTVTGVVGATSGITLNTSGALAINAAINAGAGNVSLTTTGAGNGISQNASGIITGNTLSLATNAGSATLNTATNAVANLGTTTLGTGALNLLDTGGLTVTGAVGATGGITINTSGALAINNTVNAGAGNVSLTTTGAGNAITQSAGGGITANALALTTANGNATLTAGTNTFAGLNAAMGTGALAITDTTAGTLTLGNLTANGGIAISNVGNITTTFNGGLSASSGAIVLTSTAGSITIGYLFAPGVTATAATNVSVGAVQTPGAVGAVTLTATAGSLTFGNIDTLSGSSAGVSLTSAASLVINGYIFANLGTLSLTVTGAGSTISSQAINSSFSGTGLVVNAVNGSVDLTAGLANSFTTVAGRSGGDFAYTNRSGNLAIGTVAGTSGIVSTGGNVRVIESTSFGTGALAVNQAVQASSGNVTLQSLGNLAINAALNASTGGSGVISLTTTKAGSAISQNASGIITADTLTVATNNGNATLDTATNTVSALGNVSMGTGAFALKTAAAGGLTVLGGGITADGGIAVTNTTGGITTTGVVQASNGAVALTATAGNIVTGGSVSASGGSTTLTATNGSITLGGSLTGAGVSLTSAASLTLNQNIFGNAGDVVLTATGAGSNITQTAGRIQGAGLLATALNGSVDLTAGAANNSVATIAGRSNGNFAYAAAQSTALSIGTVSGMDGIVSSNGNVAVTLTSSATPITVGQAVTASNGDVTLSSGGDLTINAAVTAKAGTGVINLTSTTGAVSENGSGALSGGGLAVSAGTNIDLRNNNTIGRFAANAATGYVLMINDGAVVIDQVGSISGITAATNVVLLTSAAGDITQTANGIITTTTGGLLVNAGAGSVILDQANLVAGNFAIGGMAVGNVTLRNNGNLNVGTAGVAGVLTASGIAINGTLSLNSNTGDITQTSAIIAGTIQGSTGGGNMLLTNAANNFVQVGTTALGTGTLTLVDGVGGLTVTGAVSAGSVSLTTTAANGAISQTAAGVITTGTLALTTNNGNATLTAATNAVDNLGAVSLGTGALNLLDTGGLTVTGAVGATGGVTLQTSGALTLNGNVNAGTGNVSLTTTGAGNAITQTGGVITAGTLTLATNNASATLNSATNAITNLGAVSLGNGELRLGVAGGLTVTGAVSAAVIALGAQSFLHIQAALNAGSTGIVALTGMQGISQTSAGIITANNLTLLTTVNGADLSATNHVTKVGFAQLGGGSGPLILVNAGGLTIAGQVLASSVTIRTTGGDLTIATGGTVRAGAGGAVLSTDANFINNRGADAVGASGGGRWLVYSAAPAGNTFGGLDSGNAAVWNATYATLPPGSVTQPGNRYIFAAQPTLTITSTGTVTKTYGDDATAPVAASSFTLSGLQGVANAFTDTASSVYSGAPVFTSNGSAATADVAGSPYSINVAAGSVASLTGYAFAFVNNGTLTVTPATLTATANAAQRDYGDANPTLSGGITGFRNGQTATTFGGDVWTTSAGLTSNVGSYGITGGLTNASPNYTITQAAANTTGLTVNKATLTFTANAASRDYGDANPTLSGGITGFKNGQTATTFGGDTWTTPAGLTSNVGSYGITGGFTNTASNYTFTQAAANTTRLTVNQATLTFTANAASRNVGDANPTLSGGITGFKNGQTATTFGGDIWSTLADQASPAGSYAVAGNLTNAAPNYRFVQAAANLTALTVKTAPPAGSPSQFMSRDPGASPKGVNISFQPQGSGPVAVSFTPPAPPVRLSNTPSTDVAPAALPSGQNLATNNGLTYPPISQFDPNQYSQFKTADWAAQAGEAAIFVMIARGVDQGHAADAMIDGFWNGTSAGWTPQQSFAGKVTFSDGAGNIADPTANAGFPVAAGSTDFGQLLKNGPVMISDGATPAHWLLATQLTSDGKGIVANDPASSKQIVLNYDTATKTVGGVTSVFDTNSNKFVSFAEASMGTPALAGLQSFVPSTFLAVTSK
jgi:filamentous hemagglutinin family protein